MKNRDDSFKELEAYFSEPEHLAGNTRPKMSAEHRAKQFAPFSAVTGLGKVLRKKEEQVEKEYD